MHHRSEPLPDGRLGALLGSRVAYLDIETTGLDAARSVVIVFGLLRAGDRGTPTVQQWFADAPADEPNALAAAVAGLRTAGLIVTYNGTRFDLPFLRWRAALHRIPFPRVPHLDLLPAARRWAAARGLPDARLQTVTASLGLPREDHAPGAAAPQLYGLWLQHRAVADREALLRHNKEDVAALPLVRAALQAAPPRAARAPSAAAPRAVVPGP